MRYGMVVDLKRCIGCYGCEIFCKTANATPPGVRWSRLLFYEFGKYPTVKRLPLPLLCMHCRSAACVEICPTGASAKRPDGIVVIDGAKCSGCLNCMMACPYGARFLSSLEDANVFPRQGLTPFELVGYQRHTRGTVSKCDFCLSRIEKGLKPACVKNCMSKARYFGDLDDPDSEVSQLISNRRAFQISPGAYPGSPLRESISEINPSVYYLGRE